MAPLKIYLQKILIVGWLVINWNVSTKHSIKGFERLVSLMQESLSAYDTDLFVPIIHSIGDLINESGKAGQTLRRIYMAEGRNNIERKDKNIAYVFNLYFSVK